MNSSKPFALTLLLGLLLLPLSAQATTLISDGFNRTGYLHGSTPDTTVGGAKWQAFNNGTASTWSTSGTVLTAGLDLQQTALIDLGANYFLTNPGVYTLSSTITMAAGTSSKWVSLGFIQSGALASGLGGAMNGSDAGWPWVLLRDNGGAAVFGGSAAANSLASLAAGTLATDTAQTVSLVLNTALANWTLDVYVGATQLDLNGATAGSTYTFTTNPDIQYVGLSVSGGGAGLESIENFSLSTVPEPSAMALMVASVGVFGLIRARQVRK
ncbi:MAG: hypothetical protein B9S32_09255 [Verrucomicrobia bacterium Tous-C9LFEB]|nr:MAG: hypothetical protein B9S32_09255 [Verrucomicrobia bacterium Tous-C9LFEB]